jgi:hypothetical protein
MTQLVELGYGIRHDERDGETKGPALPATYYTTPLPVR